MGEPKEPLSRKDCSLGGQCSKDCSPCSYPYALTEREKLEDMFEEDSLWQEKDDVSEDFDLEDLDPEYLRVD
jgi:hypothetical protein